MKRVLLVGAVVAAPLFFATPAFAGGTHFSVTAQVSCGQVRYTVHADKATVLTATDVTGGFPLVNSQWTAPKGNSSHTYRLPSATRTGGPDTVELAVTALNYPILRTDSVPWNCPPPPRPTGDVIYHSKTPAGSVSNAPSGRTTSPGGHQTSASDHPSKPCKTTAAPSSTTPAPSSSVATSSAPVTTPASSPQTSVPDTSTPATTSPALGSTTPPPPSNPVLALTGADPGPLAVLGFGGIGVGVLFLLRGLRKRGEHS